MTNSSPSSSSSSSSSPACTDCNTPINPKRAALGYRLCLACGEREARKKTYPSAPINKSSYVLITNREQLKQLNPKRLGE